MTDPDAQPPDDLHEAQTSAARGGEASRRHPIDRHPDQPDPDAPRDAATAVAHFDRWFGRAVLVVMVIAVLNLTGVFPDPDADLNHRGVPDSSSGEPRPVPTVVPSPPISPHGQRVVMGTVLEPVEQLTEPMRRAGRSVRRLEPAQPYWRSLVGLPDATVIITLGPAESDLPPSSRIVALATSGPDGEFWAIVPRHAELGVVARLGERVASGLVPVDAASPAELILRW